MEWNFSSDRAIYAQIVERLQIGIVTGYYEKGAKIPSVRELAAEAAVNPNTMQKALSDLESTGIIVSQRTAGRFVTDDITLIDSTKQSMARHVIGEYFKNMQRLGIATNEAKQIIINAEDTI